MNFVYEILKRKIPSLNEKELTGEDFEIFRRRERLKIVTRNYPKPFTSVYIARPKGSLIVLRSDLQGIQRQFYLWYELGRHILHGARSLSEYWKWLRPEKDKFEAESLPLIAMLPISKLSNFISGYEIRRGFLADLIRKRIYLLTNFGV